MDVVSVVQVKSREWWFCVWWDLKGFFKYILVKINILKMKIKVNGIQEQKFVVI